MYILGISGGFRIGYRDAAVALIKDGVLLYATEEERFNRIKGSPGQFPEQSIRFILKEESINMQDIDIVATHGITWGEHFESQLENYLLTNFGHAPSLMIFHHHQCHAASTYYPSGFEHAIVVTIDNSGDGVSTQISIGKGGELELMESINRPNSLGMFYGLITQYCGFRRDEDEFKLMGLAAYGTSGVDLDFLLSYGNGSYLLNQEYIQPIIPGQSQPMYQQSIFSKNLIDKLGPSRLKNEKVTDFYKNVAFAAQNLLERTVLHIVEDAVRKTGLKNICLAGGVALNCALNRKLMNAPFTDKIFVQPAAGDAGIALGAATLAAKANGWIAKKMEDAYLGQSFTNEEIEKTLKELGVAYARLDRPSLRGAQLISDGKVIGWFQGRSEYGPRALGNRSILASATQQGTRDLVNKKIKFRASFRPFCPSVLEEDAHLYFEGNQLPAPFMTVNYDVKESVKADLSQIVHVDGTARIQTVSKASNPMFYNLLSELKLLTGFGVCINTSFNVSHQPIVNTPREAIMTFFGCGLDALIIGNFLIQK